MGTKKHFLPMVCENKTLKHYVILLLVLGILYVLDDQ